MIVSVIIPVFNEEEVIEDCINSLFLQTYKDLEIIVIDDGSIDRTWEILSEFKIQNSKIKISRQNHLGPGVARNLGARLARGEILVFVDADMTFDPNFVAKLTQPIREGKALGTFSKQEYVKNKENIWAKCWNINKNLPIDRMHPKDYPNSQNVFRAILKKEFIKVGGFESIGYIDDHSLAEKLQIQAKAAPGAIFYHKNPHTIREVFNQARWIGKSEFKKRKIPNELLMKIVTIVRYSAFLSLINGIYKAIKFSILQFLIFKLIYDLAIEISVLESFFSKKLYK